MTSYALELTGSKSVHVQITRKRVKNINLRIARDGCVHLSAPRHVPDAYLAAFLHQHRDWISRRLKRIVSSLPTPDNLLPTHITLLGERIEIVSLPASKLSASLSDGQLVLFGDQPHVMLDRWMRQYALSYCTRESQRLYEAIFRPLGVAMPQVAVRKMKTLWGSCNFVRGKITYSIALMHAPAYCVEYVVLHELAHLLHRNHDVTFYGFIAQYMPDWKLRKQRLNQGVL